MGKLFDFLHTLGQDNPEDQPGIKPLEYGESLKLEMKGGEKRMVTVVRARENGARVREPFHGEYDMDYNDVLLVHSDNGELHTSSWLKDRGRAHVEAMTGRKPKPEHQVPVLNDADLSFVDKFKQSVGL